jgi:hypothetical protein
VAPGMPRSPLRRVADDVASGLTAFVERLSRLEVVVLLSVLRLSVFDALEALSRAESKTSLPLERSDESACERTESLEERHGDARSELERPELRRLVGEVELELSTRGKESCWLFVSWRTPEKERRKVELLAEGEERPLLVEER